MSPLPPSDEAAVQAEAAERSYHQGADRHRTGLPLADFILGSQDGLVNVLGVVLGLAAADASRRVVLAGSLAAALAESVSMAAVAYTTSRANAELYESELAREHRHIRRVPGIEREEVREIFQRKGFEGELLEKAVEAVTSNPDVWVADMMAEEHHLRFISRGESLRAGLVVGLAALVGSLVPLAPFFFLPVRLAAFCSVGCAAAALFGIGFYQAQQTVGHPVRSGGVLALIGLAAALVGFGVGLVFHAGP